MMDRWLETFNAILQGMITNGYGLYLITEPEHDKKDATRHKMVEEAKKLTDLVHKKIYK